MWFSFSFWKLTSFLGSSVHQGQASSSQCGLPSQGQGGSGVPGTPLGAGDGEENNPELQFPRSSYLVEKNRPHPNHQCWYQLMLWRKGAVKEPGFSTMAFGARQFFVVGDCPVLCSILSSIPGLYQPRDSCSPSSCDNGKCLQTLPNISWEAVSPMIDNYCDRGCLRDLGNMGEVQGWLGAASGKLGDICIGTKKGCHLKESHQKQGPWSWKKLCMKRERLKCVPRSKKASVATAKWEKVEKERGWRHGCGSWQGARVNRALWTQLFEESPTLENSTFAH